MKRLAPVVIILVVLAVGAGVFWAISAAAGHYLSSQPSATVQCQGTHAAHQVTIKDNAAVPNMTQAHLCDTLTFTNADNRFREVAFGPHEQHVAYDGVAEKPLDQGQSFTITLNQPGTFRFHDHLEDDVTGQFTVAK